MTLRPASALISVMRLACIAALLAGCVTVTEKPDRTPSPGLAGNASLRISDYEAEAGTPSLAAPGSKRRSSQSIDGRLPAIEIPAQAHSLQTIDLTSDVDDLFARMRNGFAMPDINNDLVLSHQQWYLNHPEHLRRVVERSSLYMHHIVEELDKRGMPMELALLPMVESAFNPMAYSRAKASGLWQFIPSTGKRYNLNQNWWKDERRDIVASTAAALDYLQTIYDLHGDWHLALASYNWGEGSVGRALNKNRALGLPGDYLSLTMPGETKNYVPKLQALKNIFSDPALVTELNLSPIPNRPYFSTVSKTSSIDVNVAAKLAEMPVKEFVALNPAHNRPVIQAESPIIIPAEKLETFMSNLEAHESSNKPLSYWQSYTLRPGDKLEKVAPRFGMSVANLKAVNGIQGKIKVGPGTTLLVAGQEGGDGPDMASTPEPPRLPAADPEPAAKSKSTESHTVRKGETLPSIAKHYGMSVAELKRINKLRSDKVTTGTRLTVNQESKTAEKKESKAEKLAEVGKKPDTGKNKADKKAEDKAGSKAKGNNGSTRYVVRKGDTIYSIARQFNVDKDELLRWNKLSSNAIKPGKTLTIQ